MTVGRLQPSPRSTELRRIATVGTSWLYSLVLLLVHCMFASGWLCVHTHTGVRGLRGL